MSLGTGLTTTDIERVLRALPDGQLLTLPESTSVRVAMRSLDGTSFGWMLVGGSPSTIRGIVRSLDIRDALLHGLDIDKSLSEARRDDQQNPVPLIRGLEEEGTQEILRDIGLAGSEAETSEKRVEALNGRKHVLVVGGAGYLGSVLVRELLRQGYHVRVLDAFLFGQHSLADIAGHERLEIRRGDIRHINDIVAALRGMDACILLAAVVGDPASLRNPEPTIEINYLAAKAMADACCYYQVNRFVYASTCSVYGKGDSILTEESPLSPVSLYAALEDCC